MVTFHHDPVLVQQVLEFLTPEPGKVYCDATVGGAGHALSILNASAPTGRLIGFDQDEDALAAARTRLHEFGDRISLRHGNFRNIDKLLIPHGPVDGFLLDLGVSSYQLDAGARGFSFQNDGALDMRMDHQLPDTAYQLIESASQRDLMEILKNYGEVRFPGRIARVLKEAVAEQVNSTAEVAARIERVVPSRRRIHPATTVFQALRIAINDELGALESFLRKFPAWLRKGGRVVVIAYHSLEDRLVKVLFREYATGRREEPTHDGQPDGEKLLRLLTRKPLVAGSDEVRGNPRARSAKLRAAERL